MGDEGERASAARYRSNKRPRVLPVYSRRALETKLDYLHSDPVRTGLVSGPAEWEHSSYRQLDQGLTDVAFLCDTLDGLPLW